MNFRLSHTLISLLFAAAPLVSAQAQEKVLNLYSARHYQTDEALYNGFTQQTGITIKRIEGKEDELLERIRNEGANSPADVLLTVDAARLAAAHEMGLFAPLRSQLLEARIPAHLRTNDWFSFSIRARVIIYAKGAIKPEELQNYSDLAHPRLKGKVCSRSGSHPYNLSLMASIIAHQGETKAEEWARGVVANFARPPKGGDTDQIRAVAAGECAVALSNTYYLARLMRSDKPEDRQTMDRIVVVWPDQKGSGAHINVSGGGVLKSAPHREAAVKFLEYLASDQAQRYFADGNNEWPVVAGVKVSNPALEALGKFKADTLPVGSLAMYRAKAQMIFDRSGYR
ncbi:MAG TPA: Fe(3+) ABC transporter substrate-binding protein [Accumulibacter sp.]|uniref:Fe(3+) ABC transporter substrate-binding protein n=2 Tax=Candidatus Accumulibacter TaxID=327159 RepID=A0A080M1T8_9PROT|nr:MULTISPECIES: Fe(3+) ABC transporter substrate-binding protein [Candidatus Accumulibacter]KFB75252.1 MAG: Iron uptake protein A1 precursor [Candidatus Accumulibacter cognatus]MBL8402643.1 Fe(3+) ABC transporter substrate-binding protein [Accumulibacter sp.]MBN8519306.1 Fe(3+) ABC transporter substrate-binding protein [Accumulibacter sp.]MBO3709366.1 Fe(3+) ABC transporter substrate-binding protein [Accumulibacter sp.]MCC2868345.1 Fe(3+) ABC transporter substrate-binding protein [Candidatus 